MIIKKVILKSPGSNINGVVYNKECLNKIVDQLKDKELIGENYAPNSSEGIDRLSKVILTNAACVHKNIRLEDGNIVADTTFTDNNIAELIEAGIPYSFGLRALAKFENKEIEPSSIQVITFDLVTDQTLVWPKVE